MNSLYSIVATAALFMAMTAPSMAAEEESSPDISGEETVDNRQMPSTPVDAQAAMALPRTGFSMNLGLAAATCLPSGQADCSNTYPGASLSAGIEVRFWYVGVAIEYDYGWHVVGGTGSEDVSSTATHIIPVIKGYYPMDNLELFVGLGMGYSSMAVSESSSESLASWASLWQGTKVTGGVWYDLAQFGMPAGFSLDILANLFLNYGGERCTEYAGSGPCLSGADLTAGQRDVASHLQLGTALRYTF